MKLKDFDFRIWDGKKYLKQKIYNDNINNNEYIAVTGNVDDENYVLTIEHSCESNYYGGDYDEYCKVKDFTSCNYEIELFTGLYDKNGKNIYENDIVKVEDNGNASIFKVGFSNNMGFSASLQTEAILPYQLKILASKGFEIIGNIHENAELLNENKPS
ncbi:hypothetical protein GI145_02340 [Campylobacter jejuni]|nr:hypothetical protein [Campylobacter jejuni]